MATVLNAPNFKVGVQSATFACRSRRTKGDPTGTIYFIGPAEGMVKIGFTNDLPTRLKRLQMGSPVKLYVLAIAEGRRASEERAYHRRFADCREHGEWFLRTIDVDAEIAALNARCAQPL